MKKLLSMTLALAMMLSLVACGPSAPAPTPAGTPAPSASAPVETPAAADFSGTLHYVSMFNETEPQSEVIKAAIEEFTTIYPNVEVAVDWMGRDSLKTIKASLDAGQVDVWDHNINHVVAVYNDYGYELSELMAQPNPVLGGKSYNDVSNPALIESVKQFAPDGKVHALPNIPNIMGVFFNQDLFDKAGVTELPETWDELLGVCQKLKDAGITPISIDDGYVILPFALYLGRLKGLDFTRDLVTDPSGAKWDDPAVKQAADAMQELWDKGYMSINTASNKYPAGQTEVAMGDAAMVLVASYMINEVRPISGDDFRWGCFAFPSPDGAVMPNTANSIGMNVMQVVKDCENPELAFAFITFVTTGKYDTEMSKACNSIPNAAETEWPVLLAGAKPVRNSTTENVTYGFNMIVNSDFTPVYKDQVQKLMGGQTDAASFIAACKAAVAGG